MAGTTVASHFLGGDYKMKYTGLVALSLFALVFMLALKRPFVNRWFASLAQQYRVHHLMALVVAAITLLHVILQFAALPREDWGIYLALGEISVSTAWLALVLLLLGVVSSLSPFRRYNLWYALHLVLVPAFVLAAWHAFLMTERNTTITYVTLMICLCTAGALFMLWLEKRKSGATTCTVESVRNASAGITELHLSLPKGAAHAGFKAGSVLYLRFEAPGFSHMWHPFSVASCASEPDLRLLIKGFGADTQKVAELQYGDKAYVRGPYRELTPDFARPQVWVAGGVGIAAFAGFWACRRDAETPAVEIWHFVRNEAETITAEALGLSHGASNRKQMHTVVDQTDNLTALHDLLQQLPSPDRTQFIISGPPAFMRAVRRKFRRDGVKRSQIHTEEFTPW